MNKTLIINKGVTVTVSSYDCNIYGQIINKGKIIVTGRLCFREESPKIGNIKLANYDGTSEIIYFPIYLDVDVIKKYFSSDSIYNSLIFTPGVESTIVIDKNVTIPKGKTLRLNINCTLEVKKGVTLTIKGKVGTYNEPVIRGKVIGEIEVLR